MKIIPKKTALLVIDVQNEYWNPPRLPRDNFVKTLKELIAFCRSNEVMVIYIKHSASSSFVEGTPGFEVYDAIKPEDNDPIIVKKTPGSFFETNLEAVLQKNEISNLIITGIQTQKCCDTTTREASARKYNCYFITDAVETFDLKAPDGTVIDRDEISKIVFVALHNGFAKVMPFHQLKELF